MIPSYALDAIDKCLRDVTNNHTMFGGKMIVLGKDFRQGFPVVSRAPPAPIVVVCNCCLWGRFQQLRLTQNVGTNQNEQEFSRWLFQPENGLIGSTLDTVAYGAVDITEPSICNDSSICDIFDNCTAEEMKSRVIDIIT